MIFNDHFSRNFSVTFFPLDKKETVSLSSHVEEHLSFLIFLLLYGLSHYGQRIVSIIIPTFGNLACAIICGPFHQSFVGI